MNQAMPVAEPDAHIEVADGADLFEDSPVVGSVQPRMEDREDAPEGKRSGPRDRQKKRGG
jgi:hypothetical protein